MGKKNEVKLYDGSLIVLLVFVCILAVAVVGQRTKEVKERLARERIAIPDYSDDELIARYYQINAELEGALDSVKQAIILPIGEGYIVTSGRGVLTKKKIDTLREIIALYLAETTRRGLKLPK